MRMFQRVFFVTIAMAVAPGSVAIAQTEDRAILGSALKWLQETEAEAWESPVALDVDRVGRRSTERRILTPLAAGDLQQLAGELGVVLREKREVIECDDPADLRTCRVHGVGALISAEILEATAETARVHVIWVRKLGVGFYPAHANSVLLLHRGKDGWFVARELVRELG
jgi:hypothetical protein